MPPGPLRGRPAAVVEDQPSLRRRPGEARPGRDAARLRPRRGSGSAADRGQEARRRVRSFPVRRVPRDHPAGRERARPMGGPPGQGDRACGCPRRSSTTPRTRPPPARTATRRRPRRPAEVLMPPIETCRACHLGEHARATVPSTCIMCHDYHREELDPMLPAAAQAAAMRACVDRSGPHCYDPPQLLEGTSSSGQAVGRRVGLDRAGLRRDLTGGGRSSDGPGGQPRDHPTPRRRSQRGLRSAVERASLALSRPA